MEDKTTKKRYNAKQFAISPVHRSALARWVEERKIRFPEEKVNASSTLEWIIEKERGAVDPILAEYIELRSKLNKMGEKV